MRELSERSSEAYTSDEAITSDVCVGLGLHQPDVQLGSTFSQTVLSGLLQA